MNLYSGDRSMRSRAALRLKLALGSAAIAMTTVAQGQEFTQIQSLTSRVLFAKEDRAAKQRELDRRHVEELGIQAQQQAILLEQQAVSVRMLSDQLKIMRDEKTVADAGQGFDAAIYAGQAAMARVYLADTVTIAITAPPVALSADNAVIGPPLSSAAGQVQPRSSPRVRIDGERAVLVSDGYAWRRDGAVGRRLDQQIGTWTYNFVHTPAGWKITEITFAQVGH